MSYQESVVNQHKSLPYLTVGTPRADRIVVSILYMSQQRTGYLEFGPDSRVLEQIHEKRDYIVEKLIGD
jgi:hypothetical protein